MTDPEDELRVALCRAAHGPRPRRSLEDVRRRVADRRRRTTTLALGAIALVVVGLAAGSLGRRSDTSEVAVGGSTPSDGPYYPRVGGECTARTGLQNDLRANGAAPSADRAMQVLSTDQGFAGPLALVERVRLPVGAQPGPATQPTIEPDPGGGRSRAEWRLSDGSQVLLSTQGMSRQAVEDLTHSLYQRPGFTEGFVLNPMAGLPPFSLSGVTPGEVVANLATASCRRPDGSTTAIASMSGPVPDRYAAFLDTPAPLAVRTIEGSDVFVVTTAGEAERDLVSAGRATAEQWAAELEPPDRSAPGSTPSTEAPRSMPSTTRPPPPSGPPPQLLGQAVIGTGTAKDGRRWTLSIGGPSNEVCLHFSLDERTSPGACAGQPAGRPVPSGEGYRPLLFQDERLPRYVFGRVEAGVVEVEVEPASGAGAARTPVIRSGDDGFYAVELERADRPTAVIGHRSDGTTVRYAMNQ